MTSSDLVAILPFIVMMASTVVLLLAIAFCRDHTLTVILTLAGLALAFITVFIASTVAPRQVTSLLVVDGYALFYVGLLLAATFVVVVLSHGYLEKQKDYHEEFYVLLLIAVLGSSVLVASQHFASLFLGVEILSVSLYGLISYLRDRRRSLEAGIKYLILGAESAAFLLFGMALIYADQGTMAFDRIVWTKTTAGLEGHGSLLLAGLAMMVVGFGFKLAIVPFHLWTPDVYEGAPAPVTAFVASVSKGGVFALLLRLFRQVDLTAHASLFVAFGVIAVLSMFAGNLLALRQNNVKRVLAYSSIAHLGYLLVAFLAGGAVGVTAVTFYLVAYFVTTLGAFGVVTALSDSDRDADSIDDYRGLFWRRPALATVLALSLFSLAGMPLTAGFAGKLYILVAGVGSALWWLAIPLVLSSAIGLYYYLRIIVAMYQRRTPETEDRPMALSLRSGSGLALAGLSLSLVWLGVYPRPVLELIRSVGPPGLAISEQVTRRLPQMEQLPPALLPSTPHIAFWIFDLAIPNIIVWLILIAIFFVAAWARLPKIFEPKS